MSVAAQPKIALVGYGRHAPKHLEVLRALGARIIASCNRSPQGCERAQLEGKIERVYTSITEMLERERPDGVICCASVSQIFTAACEMIPLGIPVLLEKPPGTSLLELQELKRLAALHRTPVMVGLNRRYYSVVRRAIDDAGGLGAITQVAVDWSEDPKHLLARGFTPAQVAQMIFGNSLHGLDLLAYVAGDIANPHISVGNFGEPFRWVMALQGQSARGTIGTFNSTWDSPGRWRLQFCSPGKRYIFAPLETCTVLEQGIKGERTIEPHEHDQQFKAGFYAQALDFLEMLKTGTPPSGANLETATCGMNLAQALTDALLNAPVRKEPA